jgi:hypothetical protein
MLHRLYSNLLQQPPLKLQFTISHDDFSRWLSINELPVETLIGIINGLQDDMVALSPLANSATDIFGSATYVYHYWRQSSPRFPLLTRNITLGSNKQRPVRILVIMVSRVHSVSLRLVRDQDRDITCVVCLLCPFWIIRYVVFRNDDSMIRDWIRVGVYDRSK